MNPALRFRYFSALRSLFGMAQFAARKDQLLMMKYLPARWSQYQLGGILQVQSNERGTIVAVSLPVRHEKKAATVGTVE